MKADVRRGKGAAAAGLLARPARALALVVRSVLLSALLSSFAVAADLPIKMNRTRPIVPAMEAGTPAHASCSSSACIRDCRKKGGPLEAVCESLCGETCRGK